MFKVAVVEDSPAAAKRLEEFLQLYGEQNGERFNVTVFKDALDFLSSYRAVYDIVFMDIEMPHMNGMDAAAKLRKLDKQAVLIFVTNMAQFAVRGHEVDALDYIVKPVAFNSFAVKLKKAVGILKANRDLGLVITQANGNRRIAVKNIFYIEVIGHKLVYHTETESIAESGSLSLLEGKLSDFHFMRCNNCFLVNPKHILAVRGYTVTMLNGVELQISHPRKKKFMTELADWLGRGN